MNDDNGNSNNGDNNYHRNYHYHFFGNISLFVSFI